MSPQERFWSRVRRGSQGECWPWLGFKRPSGHGLTSYKSTPCNASRKAWILTYGPIEGGLCVNHRCDNAACCNPNHMYLGTRADNMYDRFGVTDPWVRATGRKFSISDDQLETLWRMRKEGATYKECAKAMGIHHTTAARYITEIRREKARLLAAARLSGGARSRV